jgi:H+/Cl- antiporter ClcA
MNTKSDPSQNGSPIPFQAGDFASSGYDSSSSKSATEIIIFYVIGILLSVLGYIVLINLSFFEKYLDNALLSFGILAGIILISFIISKTIQVLYIKNKRKKRKK